MNLGLVVILFFTLLSGQLSWSEPGSEPLRLELKFGIEEEFRTRSSFREELKARLLNPRMIPVNTGVSRVAESMLKSDRDFWVAGVLRWCENHPKYRCDRDLASIKNINFYLRDSDQKITQLKFHMDPTVIEVKASPFKLKELDSALGEIFDYVLYGKMVKDMKPANFLGEGHVHVDFDSLFRNRDGLLDYRMYRNFVVDWANHSELYYGVLNYNTFGAKSKPMIRTLEKAKKFQDWLIEFDQMALSPQVDDRLFQKLTTDLSEKLNFSRRHALNMNTRKGTIEIRSLRNKKDLAEMKRVLALIEGRANYLKNIKTDLVYHGSSAIQNSRQGVDRFYRYVTESGLDWNEYKQLMPTPWQQHVPIAVSDTDLFRGKRVQPSAKFRCATWFLTHLLGR